ncbi:hypothetical protein V3C99_002156, partial [Haemonchus contortus]
MCVADTITEIFGSAMDLCSTSQLCKCATKAPGNSHVNNLNGDAFDRLEVVKPEDERLYRSVDEAIYPEG